jgi:ABC-2 type transport system permease protein
MKFFPLHYFLDVGLGILLKGAGLDILWKTVLGIILSLNLKYLKILF